MSGPDGGIAVEEKAPEVLDTALAYLRAGFSLVPVKTDGSKRPARSEWSDLQSRRLTDAEAGVAFSGRVGIAVIGGAISGGLEILDFDEPGFYEAWTRILEGTAPELLERLPVVRTPSGGRHVYTRVPVAAGNTKLALVPHPDPDEAARGKKGTAIETRGEGGYAIAPGSPVEVHPDRLPYELERGSLLEVPILTAEERETLLEAARSLDQCPEVHKAHPEFEGGAPPADEKQRTGGPGSGMLPGDDFNARGTWAGILEPLGWSQAGKNGNGTIYWRRPGKTDPGWSATSGFCSGGSGDLLYVFSSNAEKLETGKAYSRFGAFAVLNHSGDFQAAARDLLAQGYGDPAVAPGAAAADAKKRIDALLETLNSGSDLAIIFGAAADLAALPLGELGIVKARLREVLGKRLSIQDLGSTIRAERSKMAEEARKKKEERRLPVDRPVIVYTERQLREVSENALAALQNANDPPRLFSRGGDLTRVKLDERGRPSLQIVDDKYLNSKLAIVANWYGLDKNGHSVPGFPPREIARMINATCGGMFPALEGITTIPQLRPDGTILDSPGYDPSTGLYYQPSKGLVIPPIPENPTADDLAESRSLIDDMLADFPFADKEGDKANAIAIALSIVLRPAFGCAPLASVDAPAAGTGKSLLVKALVLAATGSAPHFRCVSRKEEENRKAITGILLEGAPFCVLDNLDGPLSSPSFSMCLTTEVWGDRLLSVNREVRVPARTLWACTANNIKLGGDLPRRCYPIRLDAEVSHPWRGRTFRHANLLGWVRDHHGELLGALLTLSRGWFASGRPAADVPALGSFEEWTSVIGGVLAHAGYPGFLANLEKMYDTVMEEESDWVRFFQAWHGREPEKFVKARTVSDWFLRPPSLGIKEFL